MPEAVNATTGRVAGADYREKLRELGLQLERRCCRIVSVQRDRGTLAVAS